MDASKSRISNGTNGLSSKPVRWQRSAPFPPRGNGNYEAEVAMAPPPLGIPVPQRWPQQPVWQRSGSGTAPNSVPAGERPWSQHGQRPASGGGPPPGTQELGVSRDRRPPQRVSSRSSPNGASSSRASTADGGPEASGAPSRALIRDLCVYCFRVLIANLHGQQRPGLPAGVDSTFEAPMFVTWEKRRSNAESSYGKGELRGCIGCLEPIVLSTGLHEYAIRSSLQDRRFQPIQLDEMTQLSCKLSILHSFEPCSQAYDWKVGTHGVLIKFQDDHHRWYSATYLPEVALEHNMSRETAIRELVAKAGYTGECDRHLVQRIECTRYQSTAEGISHKEFLAATDPEYDCNVDRYAPRAYSANGYNGRR